MQRHFTSRFNRHPAGTFEVVEDSRHEVRHERHTKYQTSRSPPRPSAGGAVSASGSTSQHRSHPQVPLGDGRFEFGPLRCSVQSDVRRDHAAQPIETQPLRHPTKGAEATHIMRIGPARQEEFWNTPLGQPKQIHRPIAALEDPAHHESGFNAFHHHQQQQPQQPPATLQSALQMNSPQFSKTKIEDLGPVNLGSIHNQLGPAQKMRQERERKSAESRDAYAMRNNPLGGGPLRSLPTAEMPEVDFSWDVVDTPTEEKLQEFLRGGGDKRYVPSNASSTVGGKENRYGSGSGGGGAVDMHKDPFHHVDAAYGRGSGGAAGSPHHRGREGGLVLVDPASMRVKNPITHEALTAPFADLRGKRWVKKKVRGPPGEEAMRKHERITAVDGRSSVGGGIGAATDASSLRSKYHSNSNPHNRH